MTEGQFSCFRVEKDLKRKTTKPYKELAARHDKSPNAEAEQKRINLSKQLLKQVETLVDGTSLKTSSSLSQQLAAAIELLEKQTKVHKKRKVESYSNKSKVIREEEVINDIQIGLKEKDIAQFKASQGFLLESILQTPLAEGMSFANHEIAEANASLYFAMRGIEVINLRTDPRANGLSKTYGCRICSTPLFACANKCKADHVVVKKVLEEHACTIENVTKAIQVRYVKRKNTSENRNKKNKIEGDNLSSHEVIDLPDAHGLNTSQLCGKLDFESLELKQMSKFYAKLIRTISRIIEKYAILLNLDYNAVIRMREEVFNHISSSGETRLLAQGELEFTKEQLEGHKRKVEQGLRKAFNEFSK